MKQIKKVLVHTEFGCNLGCSTCGAVPPKKVYESVLKQTTRKDRRLPAGKLAAAIRMLRPNLASRPEFDFTGYCDSVNRPQLRTLIKTIKRESPNATIQVTWGLGSAASERQVVRRTEGATRLVVSFDKQHIDAMAQRMKVTPAEAENEAVRRLVWAVGAATKNKAQLAILTETRYIPTMTRLVGSALEQLTAEGKARERIVLARAPRFHRKVLPRGSFYGTKLPGVVNILFDGRVSDRYAY